MIAGKSCCNALPVWTQTVALNAASLWNYRRKYGRYFHESLARLAANERKPRAQLLDEQRERLRQMLAYGRQHVPFYRGLDLPADDLKAWPIIDKQQVATAPEEFLSDEFSRRALINLQTSGTTGPPLTVWFTPQCRQLEMAFRWRHKAWGGVPFLSRSADLSGHPVVPPAQRQPPFWRKDYVERRLLCSSYHLFTAVQNVHEAQIVQRELDEVRLRIVRAAGFDDHDLETILVAARQQLGDSIRVRLEFVERIERTPTGKFRFVVSELP